MQLVQSLFQNYEVKKSKATSERASVVEQFVDEINKERFKTKYKPVTGKMIAMKTSHVSMNDLYYFLSTCKDYQNRSGSFSKCFFGSLKV